MNIKKYLVKILAVAAFATGTSVILSGFLFKQKINNFIAKEASWLKNPIGSHDAPDIPIITGKFNVDHDMLSSFEVMPDGATRKIEKPNRSIAQIYTDSLQIQKWDQNAALPISPQEWETLQRHNRDAKSNQAQPFKADPSSATIVLGCGLLAAPAIALYKGKAHSR